MAKAALEVDNLSKKYGEFTAVDNISFRVEEGEFFGLLGPNGAGKTTTISIINNITAPTGGSVKVLGVDIQEKPKEAKRLCGIVPQELALYMTLSARANIQFFAGIYGLSGRDLRERTDEALAMVGLTDRADDPVSSFSGGMKRRANLAAALAIRPNLLFLDEPTVGVDPQSRRHIFESVKRLNNEGMTIIYTSHYMEEVQELCGRTLIIDRGRAAALDTVETLIASLGGGMLLIKTAAATQSLVDALNRIDQVALIEVDGETLKIETKHAQTALPEVVSVFNRQNIKITGLRVLEPNLETVFLSLTGRELRD